MSEHLTTASTLLLTRRSRASHLPLHLLILAIAAILSLLPATAHAKDWWNDEWTIRKKITIDTSIADAGISEQIGSAALLLRFHDGNFQFTAAKEDASDVRFVAEDNKTLLPFHIERYDSLLNEALVWVKIPEIKPGAKTVLWMYYGNAGPKATHAEDAKGTYDAPTVLVYHFSEKNAPPADATGKGNTAQTPAVSVTGSLIAGGIRLDGTKPITIPVSESLGWGEGTPLTWSAWIKPGAAAPNAVLFSRRDGSKSFVLGLDSGKPFVEITTVDTPQRSSTGAALAPGSWHHLAVVSDAGKTNLFIDGDVAATVTSAVPALNSASTLGGDTLEGSVGFVGELDELNIAKAARPAGWLKFAAISQGGSDKAGKLVGLAQDEQTSSWLSEGYFGVIIKSLTPDGWAVICLLGVMAVVSWFVMITKIGYLNGISKGNHIFMKEWAHVASDLTVLDDGGDKEKTKTLGGRISKEKLRQMRQSSVYRLYHVGVEEIRHRLAADRSSRVLSSRSIQSIRSSLDGTLVREKQKIDKLIVLLTICISGGPFLGLLGTVVGVMITFAAVAAAGDVNVNAIAPGIAAALLATVAGLAVAIPSLFGYNYIISRVKDATADMHVFIDEFITRSAEFYSEPARRTNRREVETSDGGELEELLSH